MEDIKQIKILEILKSNYLLTCTMVTGIHEATHAKGPSEK